MERSASTAVNVDMILSEELDSLVTECYSNNSDNYEGTESLSINEIMCLRDERAGRSEA